MKNKIRFVLVVMTLSLLGLTFTQGNLSRKRNRPGVVYWHGNPEKKQVALTFDDGPNEPYTSEILEILKRENVHATFFMVGHNVDALPYIAKKVAEEGHVIGNHSYHHPNMILETDSRVRQEILATEASILKATGVRPRLFRPPFGGDDPLTFLQTERLGYVVVKWTISAKDWKKPGKEKILSNVLTHVQNGYIVLLHDGDKLRPNGDRSQTVAALPELIHELKDRGYELVTIPELLGLNAVSSSVIAPSNN